MPVNQKASAFLYVEEGPDKLHDIVKIIEGRNTIGRSSECSIIIDDGRLSLKHASLRCEDGETSIHDLDSQDGIKVNGASVVRAQLKDGDRISVGETILLFKALNAEAPR
jgi:pSer/pThr/pTyr-binding forkhead associated (FHA) protein